MKKNPVIAVVGPTASGKTSLSINIAKKYDFDVDFVSIIVNTAIIFTMGVMIIVSQGLILAAMTAITIFMHECSAYFLIRPLPGSPSPPPLVVEPVLPELVLVHPTNDITATLTDDKGNPVIDKNLILLAHYEEYKDKISKRGLQKIWWFDTWKDIYPEYQVLY